MTTNTDSNKRTDLFAQIASLRQDNQESVLIEPQPPRLPRTFLPAGQSDKRAIFKPTKKLDSSAKLQRELETYRKRFAIFTRDLSPQPESTRSRIDLKIFDWRQETPEDRQDFPGALRGEGNWESVQIPHYGGPTGRAVTYYRTEFTLNPSQLEKRAVFIHFNAVDYKAQVFVNGSLAGSHEGFFAPFEFDITSAVRAGANTLLVKVENDAILMGNNSWDKGGPLREGDKIYAATGPGYDDPQVGWHHCPPGMGIYQDVWIESRPSMFVRDIFVRPFPREQKAEAWVEVFSCNTQQKEIDLSASVYGQNFSKTVFADQPITVSGSAGPTVNYYRFAFHISNPRIWDLETPWLYRIDITVSDRQTKTTDRLSRSFGMRSFRMDDTGKTKGMFYLNDRPIRLHGANTMGFEQQDVMKKDFDQLRDDILLAKICHMNYWRLTQRPVQPEVYDLCDKLGLLTQTDLPLFGVLRRNQFCEAVRQAEEMERLVRSHPCNVVVSYINEPFPNAWDKPHRFLSRSEMEDFFSAADRAVHLANPDRVIKAVDGDYDPPAPGLPDNHCYNGWYNGHGLDLGKLHKGYWQKVKPGWFYGCGEFGSEGLDPVAVMRKYYPPEWLPQTEAEEKSWSPNQIIQAQTGNFHYMWFDTQDRLEEWVAASQEHQSWITALMTRAFRRDNRMVSFAIHLFIDAFPAGWMKTIMDVERTPKPAYFTYRDALSPLMVQLRSDRHAFFAGEKLNVEAWVCNDLALAPSKGFLHYQLEMNGKVVFAQKFPAHVPVNEAKFQGTINLTLPQVTQRTTLKLRLGLLDRKGKVLHDDALDLEVFPQDSRIDNPLIALCGEKKGTAARLLKEMGIQSYSLDSLDKANAILIDDPVQFDRSRKKILQAVQQGATAIFLNLPIGKYNLIDEPIEIIPCGMNPVQFVSRKTGHPLVEGFKPNDFRFWYDPAAGYVTPLLATTFLAPGWTPILTTGYGIWGQSWKASLAAAEKQVGQGKIQLVQIALAGRTRHNPTARIFAQRLLKSSGVH